jgi:hypothetical protein
MTICLLTLHLSPFTRCNNIFFGGVNGRVCGDTDELIAYDHCRNTACRGAVDLREQTFQ